MLKTAFRGIGLAFLAVLLSVTVTITGFDPSVESVAAAIAANQGQA